MIVNSPDTNILVYAFNTGCPEHAKAIVVLRQMIQKPLEWVVADQVLFELYRCLRSPAVLTKPLKATQAALRVRFVAEQIGCRRCGWEHNLWKHAFAQLESPHFSFQRTFDTKLATTLLANGVKIFHTRNTAHFANAGFERLLNPIDS